VARAAERAMNRVTRAHRAYFFVVLWFTLWVGYFGFFRPEEILRALPWPVPPLHARFIGALYLSATVFLALSMLAWSRLAVNTIVVIALAWTGWLLVVTIIHYDTFDLARRPVWFWIVAYVCFPIAAAWLVWKVPAERAPSRLHMRSRLAVGWLWLQGAAFCALAALLFVAPAWVATIWPWKISPFLAQVYSGPVLGYGVGCVMLALRRNWPETVIPTIGLLVFSLLALLGSSWHTALFTSGSASERAWFGSLAALAGASAAMLAAALGHDRRERHG
jgi:hypothetical protein